MGPPETPRRSRVPWALAVVVGLTSGLAGYVIHAALVRRVPKQIVQVRRLTDMPGMEESPAISPDGKMVAFVAAAGGRRQIWIVPVDGGTPHAITTDDADHDVPRWAPDSSKLIYFASHAIWEISAAGGKASKLSDSLMPGDLSHDGRSLAFVDGAAELMAGKSAIAKLSGGGYSNVRFSPDDKKLAYLQDTKVMVANLSGGEPVQAAGGDRPIQGFTWAPDNSGLIFSSAGNLWFLPRTERGSLSQLTFGELSYEDPDISAGGALVVSRRGLGLLAETDIVMFTGLKW